MSQSPPVVPDPMVIRSRPGWALAPFEVWIAVAAIYSGLARFFLPPSGAARAVEAALPPGLSAFWSVLYALGGLGALAGIFRCSPRLEGSGLVLLGTGIAVSTLAALAAGAAILPAVLVQGGATAACGVRIYMMLRATP